MMDQAKLDLSSPGRRATRDVRRSLSDVFGGALTLAVWLALWTWMAAGVVRPLATALSAADAAGGGSAAPFVRPADSRT